MSVKHEPTDQSRSMVVAMAINGVPHPDIAKAIPISLPTLYKHYRSELDYGSARANARVTDSLYKMAVSGRYPACTIFWAKARLGWKEIQEVDHAGAIRIVYENGEPSRAAPGSEES